MRYPNTTTMDGESADMAGASICPYFLYIRAIVKESACKNIPLITGLNVDISPEQGHLFPLTKFISWAAYVQDEFGNHQAWEQAEPYSQRQAQATKNPDQVDLEMAIEFMERAREIRLI
jgi:hypothetical protein